jgi:hypothetical protein
LSTASARVGNELAQEDFRVAVQRVDHELQQLLDFRFEAAGLRALGRGGGGVLGHALPVKEGFDGP